MGQPKALLYLKHATFLESIANNIQAAGVNRIYIITGRHGEQIQSQTGHAGTRTYLTNPDPDRGQLSSVQIAITHLEKDAAGILVALVDHPLVRMNTYRAILTKVLESPGKIIIPVYRGRGGHPVYFDKKYFSQLLHAPPEEGARFVTRANRDHVIRFEVEDEGILQDIDSPEDYHNLIRKNLK